MMKYKLAKRHIEAQKSRPSVSQPASMLCQAPTGFSARRRISIITEDDKPPALNTPLRIPLSLPMAMTSSPIHSGSHMLHNMTDPSSPAANFRVQHFQSSSAMAGSPRHATKLAVVSPYTQDSPYEHHDVAQRTIIRRGDIPIVPMDCPMPTAPRWTVHQAEPTQQARETRHEMHQTHHIHRNLHDDDDDDDGDEERGSRSNSEDETSDNGPPALTTSPSMAAASVLANLRSSCFSRSESASTFDTQVGNEDIKRRNGGECNSHAQTHAQAQTQADRENETEDDASCEEGEIKEPLSARMQAPSTYRYHRNGHYDGEDESSDPGVHLEGEEDDDAEIAAAAPDSAGPSFATRDLSTPVQDHGAAARGRELSAPPPLTNKRRASFDEPSEPRPKKSRRTSAVRVLEFSDDDSSNNGVGNDAGILFATAAASSAAPTHSSNGSVASAGQSSTSDSNDDESSYRDEDSLGSEPGRAPVPAPDPVASSAVAAAFDVARSAHPSMLFAAGLPPAPAAAVAAAVESHDANLAALAAITKPPEQWTPSIGGGLRLTREEDEEELNNLHCFVRSDLLEVFALETGRCPPKRGRRSQRSCSSDHTTLPRVGLRCQHCPYNADNARASGSSMATFFPKSVEDLYRQVCTWQRIHFKNCPNIPDDVKATYWTLKNGDNRRGRKAYWAKSAYHLGLRNIDDQRSGIVWNPESPIPAAAAASAPASGV